MKAAKHGKKVAVVEKFDEVGGGCTHWGTIPSKALREAIQFMVDLNRFPMLRERGVNFRPTYPELLKTANSVIARQVELRHGFYERNNVALLQGHAVFIDPHTVEVDQEKGAFELLKADAFILAPGSRPYRPADVDFNHPRIFDSDTLLNLSYTPQSITIYGAGTIGCEYASMFRNMEAKVNLINIRDRLLSFLDDEIVDALAYHLRDRGVLIRNNEEYEKIEGRDDGVVLHLKSGKEIKTDILLWTNGRTGNSDGMGLEALGIETDKRGHIVVNQDFQTKLPHIYAVGDVIGPPALASAAYDQGRFAAAHYCDDQSHKQLTKLIPNGIYTSPEISSLGKTERELTEAKVPYEVGHSQFKNLARAQITGQAVGMLKLLFHRETMEILGIHCFGYQAAEIIHIGQAIMAQKGEANTLMYFVNTTFNYPTMAEAYRVAALNGLNRIYES